MQTRHSLPLVEEIERTPGAEELFRRMAGLPHCLFLDSAMVHPTLGRYSFLAADPFDFVQVPADSSDGLARLDVRLKRFAADRVEGLPPFQGGAAGLFGYDLGQSLERIPTPATDEFGAPALAVGLYDVVVAMDHVDGRAWIISQGFPETEPARRERRAAERLAQIVEIIKPRPSVAPRTCRGGTRWGGSCTATPGAAVQLPHQPGIQLPLQQMGATNGRGFVSELSSQYTIAGTSGVTSNFSRDGYLRAVERAIDYIYAGDVFQVNLSQRLLAPARDGPASLYLRLRRCNPAPFAGYFDLGEFQVVS
ncbi:MAG: chorismate-binding protein, partial [Pirellulales bacterium]|nr:chorismate-binding protein [Pirellulales bacterium]